MTKTTLKISDMHCSSCVMRLEGLEDDLKGVNSAQASYQKQTLTLEYDETRLAFSDIVAVIEKLGYTIAS